MMWGFDILALEGDRRRCCVRPKTATGLEARIGGTVAFAVSGRPEALRPSEYREAFLVLFGRLEALMLDGANVGGTVAFAVSVRPEALRPSENIVEPSWSFLEDWRRYCWRHTCLRCVRPDWS